MRKNLHEMKFVQNFFDKKRSKFQIFHSKILAPATSTSPPTQHQGVRFYPRPPPQYLSKYNYLRPLAPAHQHHPGRRRRDQWNKVSRSRYHSWPINGGGGHQHHLRRWRNETKRWEVLTRGQFKIFLSVWGCNHVVRHQLPAPWLCCCLLVLWPI